MPITLLEYLCIFTIISRRVLRSIRNVSEKVVQQIKTHILRLIIYFTKIVPFKR